MIRPFLFLMVGDVYNLKERALLWRVMPVRFVGARVANLLLVRRLDCFAFASFTPSVYDLKGLS
jgi:hypothetical protein